MNILDIQATVEGFLESIVPSIVEIILLLLIFIALLGINKISALSRIISKKFKRIKKIPLKQIEQVLGIKSFRPLIALFLFLLFSRSVHNVAYQIGNLIPGRLGYSQPALLLSSVPKDTLAKVWMLYPNVENLNSLNEAINIEILKNEISEMPYFQSSYISHKKRFSILTDRITYLKFIIFYVIGISIYFSNRTRIIKICFRALILVLLMIIVLLYNSLESMESLKQMNIAKVYAVKYVQELKANDEDKTANNDIKKFEKKIEEANHYHEFPFYLNIDLKI
ncbi:MAG: hypothetical protein AB4290_23345 [Spirulina sp.]